MIYKISSLPVRLFKILFNRKTFILVTETSNKNLSVSCFAQILFISILTFIITYLSINYNKYKNYNNYAVILKENDKLKDEHKKLRKEFAKYDKKAEKINEYLASIVADKKDIKVQKPIRKDYKSSSFNEMIGQLENHEMYAYAVIEARRADVRKKIKNLGISNIVYNKLVKTATISQNNVSDSANYIANTSSIGSVGGTDEIVEKIEVVKDKPILQVSKNSITDKNFKSEIDKDIMIEKTLNLLPFGAPTNGNYRITSTYGFRKDPIKKDKKLRLHRGIDMVISDGKVLATKNGVVKFAGYKNGYGKCVDIEHSFGKLHGKNIITHYAHLDKIFVKKGQEVNKNELIGIQGNTGRSTGEHLHYEIRINDQFINPKNFIKKSGI